MVMGPLGQMPGAEPECQFRANDATAMGGTQRHQRPRGSQTLQDFER